MSPPSWTSLPAPHPTPLGHHRAPSSASFAIQQLPTGYVLHLVMNICWGFPHTLVVKNSPTNAEDMRHGFNPWVRKIPWRKA